MHTPDRRLLARALALGAAATAAIASAAAAPVPTAAPPEEATPLVVRTPSTPWIDLTRRHDLQRRGPARPVAREPGESAGVISAADGRRAKILPDAFGAHNSWCRVATADGSWSPRFELPVSLSGHGHVGTTLPDGRHFVVFHDTHPASPTAGSVVGWVGTFDDLAAGREGAFTARLFDPAPGLARGPIELTEDGDGVTAVTTTLRRVGEAVDAPTTVTIRVPPDVLLELVPTAAPSCPLVDLDDDSGRHVVVDREPGQYLGHVTTVLLEDGRTILAVYPKGHGRGPIVLKRSSDGGRTWSDRLPTPASWASSREVPTIHRVIDPATGDRRLIMWSGLHPARLASSEDDGATWSELEPVGDWGGIVVMGFVERLADGSYLAMFHDDGRFFGPENRRVDPPTFTLYRTFSHDGGRTWTFPDAVWSGSSLHLCEPGCVRSPDGGTLAVLLRENSRTRNSHVIFSTDEGATWSPPRELPASLTGDRHTARYAPDGRLFVCFRDTARESPTQGDWVGWVGTWEDIAQGLPGQYRVRFKDNHHRWDTTYPGVEALPDGTFVVTTYGHWDDGESPYILSARFTLEELDQRLAESASALDAAPGR